jgi:hypothetical protein
VLDTNVLVSLYIFSDSRFALLRDCIENRALVRYQQRHLPG